MEKTTQEEAAEVLRAMAPKEVNDMTIEEFKELPHRGWSEDIGAFKSLIILPTDDIHDSDFRCMEFVAVGDNGRPICRMSGCSDVLHMGGIGGSYLHPESIADWNIDCLKTSGLLRLFCHRPIKAGCDLSSFDVIAMPKVDK